MSENHRPPVPLISGNGLQRNLRLKVPSRSFPGPHHEWMDKQHWLAFSVLLQQELPRQAPNQTIPAKAGKFHMIAKEKVSQQSPSSTYSCFFFLFSLFCVKHTQKRADVFKCVLLPL